MIHFECNCGPCEADLPEILSWDDDTPLKCSRCESSILMIYSGKEDHQEHEDVVEINDVRAMRKYMTQYLEWNECQKIQ